VSIWLRKQGADVVRSNTFVTIEGNNSEIVAAWNFFEYFNLGQYAQIMWSATDNDISIVT